MIGAPNHPVQLLTQISVNLRIDNMAADGLSMSTWLAKGSLLHTRSSVSSGLERGARLRVKKLKAWPLEASRPVRPTLWM